MERMADWKSAVDASTGKTYWYHRKTRVSRWTKPEFIEEAAMLGSAAIDTVVKDTSTTVAQVSKPKGLVFQRDIYRFYSSDSKTDKSALDKLFAVIPEKSFEHSLLLDSSIISDLVSSCVQTDEVDVKVALLRCVWRIASMRHISLKAMQQNQTWMALSPYLARWNNLSVRVLILATFVSMILGETTDMVSDEIYSALCQDARDIYLGEQLPSELIGVLKTVQEVSPCLLSLSAEQGSKGHVLPSYFLLILCKLTLSARDNIPASTARNLAACLQRVFVGHQIYEDSEVASYAKEMLLQCMAKSMDVLEGILDGYLSMSSDLIRTAKPLGPQPSIYGHLKEFISAPELEEFVQGGVFDVKSFSDLHEEPFDRAMRDVEWIPKSGLGWQLNSTLLWLRCPALRDLIQDFWEQGGGSHTAEAAGSVLELSIDASDEVIETVCHYVHYGGLFLPPTINLQLETLKVAVELGILSLQDQLEDFLGRHVDLNTVEEIATAAQNAGYRRLLDHCQRFREQPELHQRQQEQLKSTGIDLQRLSQTSASRSSSALTNKHHQNNNSTAFRTNDLHDFDDLQDDVLLGTAATTGQRSGLDPGTGNNPTFATSNPSIDYHTLNQEADAYLQSLHLSAGGAPPAQTASLSMPPLYGEGEVVDDSIDYYNHGSTGRSSSAPTGQKTTSGRGPPTKPKSGGIYGLLLGPQDSSNGNPSANASSTFGNMAKSAGTATQVGANGRATSAGRNGGNSSRGGAGKASTLSALQEFDSSTMSLQPRFEKDKKTEAEKRLEELAKPRSQRSTNQPTKLDALDTSNLSEEAPISTPSSTRAGAKSVGGNKAAAAAKKNTTPRTQPVVASAATFDTFLDDDEFVEGREDFAAAPKQPPQRQQQHLDPPKRSQEAPRVQPRSEGHTPIGHTADDPQDDADDGGSGSGGGTQIRSSLALLKAKARTRSTRRSFSATAVAARTMVNDDNEAVTAVPLEDEGDTNDYSPYGRPAARTAPSSSFAARNNGSHSNNPSNNSTITNHNNLRAPNTGNPARNSTRYSSERDEEDYYQDDFDTVQQDGTGEDDMYGYSPAMSNRPTMNNTKASSNYGNSGSSLANMDRGTSATMQSNNSTQQRPSASQGHTYANPPPRQSAIERSGVGRGYDDYEDNPHDDDYYGASATSAPTRSGFQGSSGGAASNYRQQYDGEDEVDEGVDEAAGNTEECPDCGRHFLPEPFARHVKICRKVFVQKRKPFDSSKKRLAANPETLMTAKKGRPQNSSKSGAGGGAAGGVSKWKEQSKQFREAMRAAREYSNPSSGDAQGGQTVNAAPKQPYIDPSLIQCPNCQRRFNDKAAERHIPLCKNIIAKPSMLRKGGGANASAGLAATQMGSNSNNGSNNNNGGFQGARTMGASQNNSKRFGGGGGGWA